MQIGAFKQFKHEHYFCGLNDGILMTDIFDYQSPFGILGKLADKLFLEKHMSESPTKRNRIIQEFVESNNWRKILTE
jgi:ligand-binding SRPBCC domain-containing protein